MLNKTTSQAFLGRYPLWKFLLVFQLTSSPIRQTNQNQSVQRQHGNQSIASLTLTNQAWDNLENFFVHRMELFEIGFQWIGTIFKIFVQVIVVILVCFAIISYFDPLLSFDGDEYKNKMILKNDSRLIISDQSHLEYFCIILRPNLKNI